MLETVPCFQALPADALHRLERGSQVVEPRDGSAIFAQGDPADAVYAVIGGDGHVRIGSSDARSKSLLAQLFGRGEIFGELGVIDGDARSAEAVAIGRVTLLRIGASAFREALHTQPLLGAALARILAQRLRRTHVLLQDAAFAPLQVRLARQLLYLAAVDGKKTEQGVRIAIRFRQPDLADLLGATSRSIITILNDWRARRWVVYDATRALLTISDMEALRALTMDDSA